MDVVLRFDLLTIDETSVFLYYPELRKLHGVSE